MPALLTYTALMSKPIHRLVVGTCAVVGAVVAIPATAQVPVPVPAPVHSGYTYVDDTGRVVTVRRNVARANNGYSGVATVQTNRGYGGTRAFSGQRLGPDQSGYNSRFVGNSGAASQSRGAITCDGAGECFRSGRYIGPRGGVVSTNARGRVAPDGRYSGFSQTVGPRGRVFTRDAQSARTEYGRAGRTVRTGPVGASVRDFERVRRPGGYTETSTYSGPGGRSFERRATVDCRGGACARTATRVGPQGRVADFAGSSRRVAPGAWEGSRTYTDLRGRGRTRDWRWNRKGR